MQRASASRSVARRCGPSGSRPSSFPRRRSVDEAAHCASLEAMWTCASWSSTLLLNHLRQDSAQYNRSVGGLYDKVEGVVAGMPQRCSPMVLADANSGLGHYALGDHGRGMQNALGDRFLRLLETHQLAAANMRRLLPATYYRAQGEQETIDFIGTPQHMPMHSVTTHIATRKALHVLPSHLHPDHVPVLIIVEYDLPVARGGGVGRQQWNTDRLPEALQTGVARRHFLVELDERLMAVRQEFDAEEVKVGPEEHWQAVVRIVIDVWMREFSAAGAWWKPASCGLRAEQRDMLRQRWALLSRQLAVGWHAYWTAMDYKLWEVTKRLKVWSRRRAASLWSTTCARPGGNSAWRRRISWRTGSPAAWWA